MTALPDIILVPVDGSKGANAAAAYAGTLAEKLGVPVRLLFAFPESAFEMFGIPSEAPTREQLKYFSPEAFEELRNDTASAAFKAARDAMSATGAKAEDKLLTGDPAKAILAHAEGAPGCMLVMGRRGLSHFREVLIGSVTQRVLHHATCPVLVMR
ncbi:MAG: universal stress protein [Aquisalimonadaceae bacterium]